jgi:uncharacterized protein YjeT (DUF2065 family)
MEWFLYAFSLILIAVGSCAILYTAETRSTLKTTVESLDPKILAALPAVLGLLLLICAGAGAHAWFIRLLGLLAVLKGVMIFMNPADLWSTLRRWYLEALTDRAHRLTGIIAIILGTVILSWIQ